MPLPAPNCPTDTGPEVCCDGIFLLGDRIRTVAWQAVMTCEGWTGDDFADHEDDCKRPFRTYMTLGRIQDPHGDAVIVSHVRSFTPNNSPSGRTEIINAVQHQFHVEIRMGGWPTIGADPMGGSLHTPSPEAIEMATRHMLAHSQMAWDAVRIAAQRSTLFASSSRIMSPRGVQVSELLPLDGMGNHSGHQFDVAVVKL